MAQFNSPFLVGLNYAFQSKAELFFVMPFLPGVRDPPPLCCFAAAAFTTAHLPARSRSLALLALVPGGDLRYQMNQRRRPFPEDIARFYAAELLLGLEHLHSLHIL